MDVMFIEFLRAANFVDVIMSSGYNTVVAIIYKFVNFGLGVYGDGREGGGCQAAARF